MSNDFAKRREMRNLEVNVNVCALWEKNYKGGADFLHGGVSGIAMDDNIDSSQPLQKGGF